VPSFWIEQDTILHPILPGGFINPISREEFFPAVLHPIYLEDFTSNPTWRIFWDSVVSRAADSSPLLLSTSEPAPSNMSRIKAMHHGNLLQS